MSTRKSELHDAITEAVHAEAGPSIALAHDIADRILADPRVLPLIEGPAWFGDEHWRKCAGLTEKWGRQIQTIQEVANTDESRDVRMMAAEHASALQQCLGDLSDALMNTPEGA